MKFLLDQGADINAVSSTQNTALTYACGGGHLQVCIYDYIKFFSIIGGFSLKSCR